MSLDPKVYDNDFENKWCPGCGNFGILTAVVLGVGLACDLLVTPAVLRLVYGGRKRC